MVPEATDICLIAVTDNAIAEVASRLPKGIGIVAHTSGTTTIDTLAFLPGRKGVFYPLQTFTKGRPVDLRKVSFFLEGDSDSTVNDLSELAEMLGGKWRRADSATRKSLHIAAVFACNFLNRMLGCAGEILADEGLGLDVIRPLVEETVAKAWEKSPEEGQTGPARRGDTKTITEHLRVLRDRHPDLLPLYSLITDSIREKYNK